MVFQQVGCVAAKKPVGVLGKATEVAVELLVPVGEGPFAGQMLDLIDEAGTQAAAVDFLQGHKIKLVEQLRHTSQLLLAPGVG